MTADTVLSLVQSKAFAPAALLAAYLLLRWASTRFAWLAVPNRAHYVAILLAGLAVVAPAAAAGHLPDAGAILTAVMAMATLALPGLTPAPKTAQGGFARLGVLWLIVWLGVAIGALNACLSSSQAKNGGSAGVGCAADLIGKYFDEVKNDLVQFDFTAALDKLKADNHLEQDALNCVVAAVVAAFETNPGTAMHGQPSPVVINGREYLAAHGKTAAIDVHPAAWLAASTCESPNEEPAVDCKPFEAMKYDGCRWVCQ